MPLKPAFYKVDLLPTGVAKGVDMCVKLIGIRLEQRDMTNMISSEKKCAAPRGFDPAVSWPCEIRSVDLHCPAVGKRRGDSSVCGVSRHWLCVGKH